MATAILEAAQRAFADRGYDGASVEEIADAADVAIGSVYNHFGSKEGLLWAAAERALHADERYLAAASMPGLTPRQQIAASAQWFFRLYRDHPELFRLLAFPHQPQSGPAAAVAARVAARVAEENERLVDAIRRGIAAGQLRDVPPDETAAFLWAAWRGALALGWRPDALHRPPDQLASLYAVGVDVLTRGLLP
jgi:AcrR family transcriptional regulator